MLVASYSKQIIHQAIICLEEEISNYEFTIFAIRQQE